MELKAEIIKLLKEEKELASEEIMSELDARGLLSDYMEARSALIELLREGLIEKVPSPQRRKFIFRLKSSSPRSYPSSNS